MSTYKPFKRRWEWIQQVKTNKNLEDYWKFHHLPVEWATYEEFRDYIIRDLGFPPKGKRYLNRIDQNKGWISGNLRWADGKERGNNCPNYNTYITYKSQKRTMKEWADLFGINYHTFYNRYYAGWGLYRIQTTPIEAKFRRKNKRIAK